MQGQRGAVGSLPDTIGLPLSTNDSTLDQQIFWNNMNNSVNPIPNGNSMSLGGWSSSSSSSSPFNGDGSLLGLPLFEPVPGLPSFAESSNSQQAASRRDLNINLEAENVDDESQIVQHPTRKRKAIEGQSSRNVETNVWPAIPSIGGLSIPTPTAHNTSIFPAEHMNPRLSLAIGTASEIPLTLNVSSGAIPLTLNVSSGANTDSSRRNLRARTNSSSRRQIEINAANTVENSNNGSQMQQQLSRLFALNSASERGLPTDSTISRRRAAVGPRRTAVSSRWNRGSSSRQLVNPQPTVVVSSGPGESNTIPNSTNLNLSGGDVSGSASRPAAPMWFPNQYPTRRLDFLQQSLIAPSEIVPGSSTNLQGMEIPTGVGEVMLPQLRQADGALGLPYSLRTPAVAVAANARRSRIMSEIRNALDLMRRGDGLRAEDVMVLEQSMFFRMADAHRDMRLDVDNMSYEELLALEDRIGYVNTGLSEEAITNQLKKRTYFAVATDPQTEFEPCCICQEEYSDGKEIGTLDCGHEFHAGCIKQWLSHKNVCPICKATGLKSSNNNDS